MMRNKILLCLLIFLTGCNDGSSGKQTSQKPYEKDILFRHEESEGMVGIELKDGRVGFENSEGELVIPFNYDKAGPKYDPEENFIYPVKFSEGMSPVKNAKILVGYIDKTGHWAIEPQYQVGQFFYKGLARVIFPEAQNFKLAYINKQNEIVYGPYDKNSYKKFIMYRDEGHALFQSEETGLWGILGPDGQVTVPAKW